MSQGPAFRLGRFIKDAPEAPVGGTQPDSNVGGDFELGGKMSPAAIIWDVQVDSVEELLVHPTFGPRVTSGLVFVQNKRPMADLLMHLASEGAQSKRPLQPTPRISRQRHRGNRQSASEARSPRRRHVERDCLGVRRSADSCPGGAATARSCA